MLRIIYENELTVHACNELVIELERVLNYDRLKKCKPDVKEAIRILKEATCHYALSYPVKNYIPEDSDDNYVIALAIQ